MKRGLAALAVVAFTAPVAAQWLNHPTPGLRRTRDGKPNLTAPAPRTADGKPDLTGLWNASTTLTDPGELSAWAKGVMRERARDFHRGRPSYQCLPSGPEMFGGGWKHIVQTPTLITILNDDSTYRRIFLDGRSLERDPHPTWMGYSVGHWEGNTLVVDSFGFNDRTWLPLRGLPHSESLRVRERFTRQDTGHMQVDMTFTDPAVFTKPWTVPVLMQLQADTEMLEAVCETRTDYWVSAVADVRKSAVTVAPGLLTRYVGTYSGFWGGRPRTVEVTLVDGELRVTSLFPATPPAPLIAQSETLFESSEGLAYEFPRDGRGPAAHVVEIHTSGNYRYERQR